MNDAHKPSHDEPRRPLRLQPLPRPPRSTDSEPEPDAREASTEGEPEAQPEVEASVGWIHEWDQPATSTDA